MNRILKGAVAATALVGVAAAAPTEASANPLIIAPALAVLLFGGVAVGGAVVGASIADSSRPHGRVMVSDATAPAPVPGPAAAPPAPGQMSEGPVAGPMVADASASRPCYPTRAKLNGIWHDIEVCD